MKPASAITIVSLLLFTGTPARSDEPIELNTILMRSTFKLAGERYMGTAFVVGRPHGTDPKRGHYVLVTAAHVMKEIAADDAVLFLRKKDGDRFNKIVYPLKIRDGGRPLWTAHPHADVAVMYVRLPKEADILLLHTDMLATDELLAKYLVHPGDRLACLGFPKGAESNLAGFPILRSGHIASYPLTPTSTTKSFLFDFKVLDGNSGGPVYLVDSNRYFGGGTNLGSSVQLIMGLVGKRRVNKVVTSNGTMREDLGLGVVIHASLIREALDLLPAPPKD